MSKHGVRVHELIEQARAAEGILDCAETTHADMIAMSTHGRSGASRFLMGSVADRVMQHARILLLLVR